MPLNDRANVRLPHIEEGDNQALITFMGSLTSDVTAAHSALRRQQEEIDRIKSILDRSVNDIKDVNEKLLTYYQLFLEVRNEVALLKREQTHLIALVEETSETSRMTLAFLREHALDEQESVVRQSKHFDRLTKAIKLTGVLLLIVVAALALWLPELDLWDKIGRLFSAFLTI